MCRVAPCRKQDKEKNESPHRSQGCSGVWNGHHGQRSVQGEPRINQHLADGPQVTTKGRCDRDMGGAFSVWLQSQALSSWLENVFS